MAKLQEMTDNALLAELGNRLARQRLGRNMTQSALAREAGISKRTLLRIEAGESTQVTHLLRVLRALQLLGNVDALVPIAAASPIAQLRARGHERRRASPGVKQPGTRTDWTWGSDNAEDAKNAYSILAKDDARRRVPERATDSPNPDA